jgi:hypothetical protein
MGHPFDPGPVEEPFASLVRDYPGEDVYPLEDFRTEWGPIFHRGRLDGSARVLILGQDPAASVTVARRILVGEAGRRVQGLLAKLGIDRSYVMFNTFLYSVFGQGGGSRHKKDPKIAEYRNRWLEALLAPGKVEAVIGLGELADLAWQQWIETPAGKKDTPAFKHVSHPTRPESSSKGDAAKKAEATKTMLAEWNVALEELRPHVKHPDADRPFEPYGDDFEESERPPIPEEDMPPGLPEWMRSPKAWASREGETPDAKRRTLVAKVPSSVPLPKID